LYYPSGEPVDRKILLKFLFVKYKDIRGDIPLDLPVDFL
jgi:hypothetical protein